MLDPAGKHLAHRVLLRIAQECVERLDDAPQIVRRPSMLEPEKRFDGVAHAGRRMQPQTRFVDQMISELRLIYNSDSLRGVFGRPRAAAPTGCRRAVLLFR